MTTAWERRVFMFATCNPTIWRGDVVPCHFKTYGLCCIHLPLIKSHYRRNGFELKRIFVWSNHNFFNCFSLFANCSEDELSQSLLAYCFCAILTAHIRRISTTELIAQHKNGISLHQKRPKCYNCCRSIQRVKLLSKMEKVRPTFLFLKFWN